MIKWLILIFVWYPLRRIIHIAPTKAVSKICNIMGILTPFLYKKQSQIMQTELEVLIKGLPDKKYNKIVIEAFTLFIKNEIERLYFDKKDRILSLVEFEGLEHLDSALSRGKGAILALFHFGNHFLVMPALGYRGYPICQLANRSVVKDMAEWERLGMLQRLVAKRRREIGNKVPTEMLMAHKLGKKVFKVLKNNKILLWTVDGRAGKKMKPYKILGREINLSNSIFRISLSTGSPVIPLYIIRRDDGIHRLIISNPIEFDSPDSGVKKFLAIFKDYFLAYPHHYAVNLMFEKLRIEKCGDNPLFGDYK